MKNLYFIVLISLLFSGCEGFLETNVKISELKSTSKYIDGDLALEVTSCNDFSDSRKKSSSVIDAQQTIPYIFKGAEYIECFRKDFNSYVHFSLPIVIDTRNNGELASNEYINLISNESNLLSLAIPDKIIYRLRRVKEDSFGINEINLNVQIRIINDTNEDIEYKALSAYIDNKPQIFSQLIVKKGESFNVILSDVSIDNALDGNISKILIK